MSEQPTTTTTTTATTVTPVPPPGGTQFVAAPKSGPAPSGKPGCGYTILIVIVTIIMTIVVEIIIGAVLIGFVTSALLKNVKKEWAPSSTSQTTGGSNQTGATAGGKVTLTADQKKMIESFGVKAEDIPADFPIEKVICVQNAIGQDRTDQIMKGTVTPGIMDFFRARGCL